MKTIVKCTTWESEVPARCSGGPIAAMVSRMDATRGLDPQRRESTGRRAPRVVFRDALAFWLRLGFINFGGPAGQIAIMHEELVVKRRWIDDGRFLHALNYCMLLPGPEAQQLAIYIGWLLNGTLGGIVAGVLFVLPAAFVMLGLSWLYAVHGDVSWVAAIFYGLRAAVIAIVAGAVLRVGARALGNAALVSMAIAAFVGIFVLDLAFPVIILTAGVIGLFGARLRPDLFRAHAVEADEESTALAAARVATRPSLRRSALVGGVGLAVWWGPLVVVGVLRGPDDVLTKEALFFSQAALVTFGGAYAVLSYINRAAVGFGWLGPGQIVTGLGLAESTPGPLIMVTEFVGFLGAYRLHGDLDPVVAGCLGALVTVWATFAPCFLWIFLGAPFIERLRGNASLNGALSAVTAAVVGVIANLALVFGIQTLFSEVRTVAVATGSVPAPDLATIDVFATAVAVVAFIGMWRRRWGIVPVVLACALVGLLYRMVT
jgi:chromate transporter